MNDLIYLDSAATTPVDPDVYRAIQPYFCDTYGNPSSLHSVGRIARRAIEKAREQVADCLNCETSQVFFTSGATEADNWAIQMQHEYLEQWLCPNNKMLYSSIEHKAILNSIDKNLDVAIPVDKNGIVDIDFIKTACCDMANDRVSVCVMWISNEVGSIQPIKELSDFCYEHKIPFHVDATQSVGKIPISLKDYKGITTLAFSGHKIHSCKGCGCLIIRDPNADYVKPFIYGGGREYGLRAGTENVPAIIGLGTAMEKIAHKDFDNTHVYDLHKYLLNAISEIEGVRFNGEGEHHSPYYLSVSFKGIEAESLVLSLDRKGICVSAGSACNSGSTEPSYVLKAINVPEEFIHGTIRITFSDINTLDECVCVANTIKEEVAKLRSISPNWKG